MELLSNLTRDVSSDFSQGSHSAVTGFLMLHHVPHLVNGQDRLGDQPVPGVVGERLPRGDHIPVLPHDPLGRLHHPGHHALELQPGPGPHIELGPRGDLDLQ